MKFRKKPVVIEAIQYLGNNLVEVANFMNDEYDFHPKNEEIIIRTLEGDMKASIGDWIIKGVNGEFYPCKPEIFEKTYEIVD